MGSGKGSEAAVAAAAGEAAVLVFTVRAARDKARAVATVEALCLLGDLDPVVLEGGPLSERGGVFWVRLRPSDLAAATPRLVRLGYSESVDLLEPEPVAEGAGAHGAPAAAAANAPVGDPAPRRVRWRRRWYRLVSLYAEDAAALREEAPDRRVFLWETGSGEVKAVRGYRGDGAPLSRRGLPVYDARMLVNLAAPRQGKVFLDPFAGIGGIVREAAAGGCGITLSTDIDPALRHGLRAMSGNRHAVADASRLPFGNATVDAVATEPPYHAEATAAVHGALREMRRVLRPGGRLAVLCAASQADGLRAEAAAAGGLEGFLDAPVNRKGLDVVVLAWRKAGGP